MNSCRPYVVAVLSSIPHDNTAWAGGSWAEALHRRTRTRELNNFPPRKLVLLFPSEIDLAAALALSNEDPRGGPLEDLHVWGAPCICTPRGRTRTPSNARDPTPRGYP